METSNNKIITLSKNTKKLSFRENANKIFNELEKLQEKRITIDFSDITLMSRSFAQQYIKRKMESAKEIKEVNQSKNCFIL